MYILGVADVAEDPDLPSVLRDVGLAFELCKQLLSFQEFGAFLQHAGAGVHVGVQHDSARSAIDDHLSACIFGLELIAHADNRGDAHRAGQDRRVARA